MLKCTVPCRFISKKYQNIMAEAPSSSMAGERVLDKLTREITCSLCNNHYNDPRVLPCCHYYCLGCLSGLLTNGSIICPNCKAPATTGCSDLEQLPPALVVKHFKLLHSRVAKLEDVDLQCEMCSDAKAVAFCQDCEEFICTDCLSYHQKMKTKFRDHQIFLMAELKSGGLDFPTKHPPVTECPEHKEPYKLYCFNCCKLVCRDCIVIEHASHHYEFVAKSVSNTRETLNTYLLPLKEKLSGFKESAKLITEAKDNVTNQGVLVARHIHERFTAMIELLKKRELELLRKTESVVKKKMSNLDQQEKELHKAVTAVVAVMDYVNSHLDTVSDEELLSVQHQLYTRIESIMQVYRGLKLSPVEIANLAVKITLEEDLSKMCLEKALVYLFPQYRKSYVHVTEVQKKTVQLVTDIKAIEHHIQTGSIDAKLVAEVDGSEVRGCVFKAGKGLYEVTYMPQIRGRHKLHISVNGEPISNSPFQVFVAIPPNQLGPDPIYTISGLKHPYAAIFDEDQNLLVTESNSTKVSLLLRDAEGKISNKVSDFVDLKSSNPSGIAADEHGNFYITSASGHSISKYSKEGLHLATKENQGANLGELTHPCGVCVIDGKVYVCDRNNCRVQVFNRDLAPIRTFGCYGKEHGQFHWPYNLVQDNRGCVYITDCNNHRIQVFNKDGRFLHEFGNRGSERNGLKRPMGVSLAKDGNHVFVSEYDKHRVSVYQLNGTFVTSFGHYGTKKGELCYPVGMAIDSNGFLYVCDQGNNRIQVF